MLYDVNYSYDTPKFGNFQIEAESLTEAFAVSEKKLDVELDGFFFSIDEVKEVV